MSGYTYYIFQQVPLDEGGYVLHYVSRYKTVVGMIRRVNRTSRPWLYLPETEEWHNADFPDDGQPMPPYPVLGAGVPAEIRHLVS